MIDKVLKLLLPMLLFVESAAACIVRWESPDELKREARVVVVGSILSASARTSSFRGHNYAYVIRVEGVERGNLPLGETRVTFEDLLQHLRGKTMVCPLKHGSGIEHQLRVGASYRFFLRSREDPEILIAEDAREKSGI